MDSIIDQLVDIQAINDQLGKLDKRIEESIKQLDARIEEGVQKTRKLVDVFKELEFAVQRVGTQKEFLTLLEKIDVAEKAYTQQVVKTNALLQKRYDVVEKIISKYGNLADAGKDLADSEKKLSDLRQRSIDLDNQKAASAQKIAEASQSTAKSSDEMTSAEIEQMRTTKELTDAQKAHVDGMNSFNSTLEEIRNSAQGYEEKLKSLKDMSWGLEAQLAGLAKTDPFSDKSLEIAAQIRHVDAAIKELTATRKQIKSQGSIFGDEGKSISEMRKQYNATVLKIREYEDRLESLKKQYKDLGKLSKEGTPGDELTSKMRDLKEELSELNKVRIQQGKAVDEELKYNKLAAGSMVQLSEQLKQLEKAYRDLSPAERESAGGKDMLKKITTIDKEITALDKSIGDNQRKVGEYERAQTALGKVFGINIKQLGIYGLALKGLSLIKDGFKKIVSSTSDAQDRFAIVTEKAKAGIDYFWRSLSSGNFDNFLQGVQNAIKAAENYKEIMIELENRTRSLSVAEAEMHKDVAELKVKAADTTLPKDERMKYYDEAIAKETEYFELKKKNAEDIKNTELDNQSQQHNISREYLEDMTKNYHLREKDIEAAEELIKLTEGLRKAEQGEATFGAEGEVIWTKNEEAILNARDALNEFQRVHRGYTSDGKTTLTEFTKQWEKYGTVVAGVRDNLAKNEIDAINTETQYNNEIRRMTTARANLEKGIDEEGIKSNKIRIDIINLRLQAESDALKKTSSDEKKSLDERLKAYAEYQEKQKQILQNNAGVARKEAGGDEGKLKLVEEKLQNDLNKISLDGEEFREEQAKKVAERIGKARFDIINLEINAELEKVKKVGDNEYASLTTRIGAYKTYYDTREKQIEDQHIYELERERASRNVEKEEVLAMEKKRDDEIRKLREESEKTNQKILIDSMKKDIDNRKKQLGTMEAMETAALSEQYAKGKIKREEYEKKKKEITEKYAREVLDAEQQLVAKSIETLEKAIDDLGSQVDTSALLGQVTALRKRMEAISVESNERIGASNKSLWDKWVSGVADSLGMTESQLKEFADSMAEIVNGIMDLMSIASEKRIAGYDAEIDKIKEREQQELESLNNAAATEEFKAREKARIEARSEAQRQQIKAKKEQEQQKQARWEKAWAITQIIINTATGILKTIGTTGFPAAIPLIAAVAALGVIQTAVVAAQPIPKYEKGTEDHPGGTAIVGERRHEAIILPSGKVIKSPARPTIADLPKHTIVKPDYRAFIEDQTRETLRLAKEVDLQNKVEHRELLEETRLMRRDIRAIKGTSVEVNMDTQGFYNSMGAARNRTNYMNRKLHRVFQ